jgi:hypothetical protein
MDEKDVPNVGKSFESPLAAQRSVENDRPIYPDPAYAYRPEAGQSQYIPTPPFVAPPQAQPKPFYKSKGFWGSVLGVASLIVPLPFRPIVAIAGSALGLYGRAQAQGPLDFSLRQQQ